MSNTPEVHVSLFDGDYQVTRFVAESSSMNNVYAGAINLIEHNNKVLQSENEYWVEVMDINGKYLTRVKFDEISDHYLAGFISQDRFHIEWHEIEAHHILNPSYQFKRIQSL
jgi:hypothetical protein